MPAKPTTGPVIGGREAVDINLENLKKQAKALLRDARAEVADAVSRVNAIRSRPVMPKAMKLSHVQFAIAREQGFASWPELVAELGTGSKPALNIGVMKLRDRTRLPLVPLRDLVLFPGSIVPIFIGREQSLSAIRSCLPDKPFLVCAQQEAQMDRVGASDLYDVATLATVREVAMLGNGTIKALVEAHHTVRLEAVDFSGNHAEATAVFVPESHYQRRDTDLTEVREQLARAAELLGLPAELTDAVMDETDGDGLVRMVGQYFGLSIADRQRLLSLADPGVRLKSALEQVVQLEDRIKAMAIGDYVGRYGVAPGFVIEVTQDDRGMLIASSPWDRHVLQARDEGFFVPVIKAMDMPAERRRPLAEAMSAGWPRIHYRFLRQEPDGVHLLRRHDRMGQLPDAKRLGLKEDAEVLDRNGPWHQHVGRYEAGPGAERLISLSGGQFQCDGGALSPISDTEFLGTSEALRVSFKLNDAGRTIGMRVRNPDATLDYFKMD